MIYSHVIIVGGGPAGATCGWKLKENGIDCLILDKQDFPRTKLCAGWITPQVINDLNICVDEYPYNITEFDHFRIHIFKKELDVKVHQYAIRRYEFDDWLLKQANVPVEKHEVKEIKKEGNYYVIDNRYYCKYLIGAGGTHCPVYRTFFKSKYPRPKKSVIVTMEEEIHHEEQDRNCHLWFLRNNLPGYAWYVPQNNGYVSVGIGGFQEKLEQQGKDIKDHWRMFKEDLTRQSMLQNHSFNARGYYYHVRHKPEKIQIDNAFLIGDAAGIATRDMGEGIGPAVQSGIAVARAIISGQKFSLRTVKKRSFSQSRVLWEMLRAYLTGSKSR